MTTPSRRTVLTSALAVGGLSALSAALYDVRTAPPARAGGTTQAATPAAASSSTTPPRPRVSPAHPSSHASIHPSSDQARPVPVGVEATLSPVRWTTAVRSVTDFTRRHPQVHLPSPAVVLTVDDGPHPHWTPLYLQLLQRYGVTATFCMIGSQVQREPAVVRAVAAHGHRLANHTFTHDERLTTRSSATIAAEIDRTTAAIRSAAGVSPTQFRAPGGNWGPALLRALNERGMTPLGWDVDPRDWSRPGVAHITGTMLTARPADIILCHDGGGDRSQTYAALTAVIPALLRRGYHFVALPG